jgi:LysM repeat protein
VLSLRLKRRSGGALVGATLTATLTVVLAALMLALLPAVAEAQTEAKAEAKTKDKNPPSSVVVRPGDSLWSISEEHLAPNATPRRIVRGAEQIYALNRNLIGADPNLIFVGQELLVPPAMSGRPTGASEAAQEASQRDRTAKGTMGSKAMAKAPRTAPGGADARGGDVSAPVAEREAERETQRETQREADPVSLPVLPDETAAPPVPAVRTLAPNELASNDSPSSPLVPVLRSVSSAVASAASVVAAVSESFADAFAEARANERRLLGLGVLLLTLVVAVLVAWKIPMRRTTREDAERWGIPMGYYYASPAAHRPAVPFAPRPGSPGDLDREETNQEQAPVPLGPEQRGIPTGNGSTPTANGARDAAAVVAAARRVRKARAKAKPRNGLALGAHNPEVRSASLLARAPARARKPRLQRRAAGPPFVSAASQKRGGEPR